MGQNKFKKIIIIMIVIIIIIRKLMECMGRKEYPLAQIDGTHAPTQHKLSTVPDCYNWKNCREEQKK
jgi:hypothetical protein